MGRSKNNGNKTNRKRRSVNQCHKTRVEQEKKRAERKSANLLALSHVYEKSTTATSRNVQAAAFASTAELVHMPVSYSFIASCISLMLSDGEEYLLRLDEHTVPLCNVARLVRRGRCVARLVRRGR